MDTVITRSKLELDRTNQALVRTLTKLRVETWALSSMTRETQMIVAANERAATDCLVTYWLVSVVELMLEKQTAELSRAVEQLAVRLHTLGVSNNSSPSEVAWTKTDNIIEMLTADHAAAARTARRGLSLARTAHDHVTYELLVRQARLHNEATRDLQALLKDSDDDRCTPKSRSV